MSQGSDLDQWIPFFQYIAAIAAALLAIAFLTFQVESSFWKRDALKQSVALTTLTELAAPVFFGLIFLFPGHPWQTAGVVVGVVGYAATAWHVYRFVRGRATADRFDKGQMWGTLVTTTTFSIVLWWPSLEWKAGTLIWLIFSGSAEAWILLGTEERNRSPVRRKLTWSSRRRHANPAVSPDRRLKVAGRLPVRRVPINRRPRR